MSGEDNLQFVWDIMMQSEWWKQHSEMVNRSQNESQKAVISSGTGSGSDLWWTSSSGNWWMEIPEQWWSSFNGSGWNSSAGSGVFGSGFGPGYGLQLI